MPYLVKRKASFIWVWRLFVEIIWIVKAHQRILNVRYANVNKVGTFSWTMSMDMLHFLLVTFEFPQHIKKLLNA